MVDFSVIIATYNRADYLRECLNSLASQTHKNFETIIVDDGSTDNTKDLIKSFPVKLLTQKHLGPAKARNLGAEQARGEILVFIDADMTFDKEFISDLTDPIKKGIYKGTFSKNELIGNWANVSPPVISYSQQRRYYYI